MQNNGDGERPKLAALYLRISDDPGQDGKGIERQREDLEARAKREGLTVRSEHIFDENDTGASRYSRKPREKYQAMMAAAERGEFEAILVDSLSRLTRRKTEWETLAEFVERTGVFILTNKSGDPNLTTADGRMVASFIAAADAAEVDRLSERLKRQQAQARSEGRALGKRPFGWGHYAEERSPNGRRRVLDRDKLNPVEGPALAKGVRDVLAGKSLAGIAREWTLAGVLRPGSDDPWTVSLVKRQLIRWRNAGVVEHLGRTVDGVRGAWKPVCSGDELERVRAILLNPARNTRKGGATPSALLSGVAVCGSCGRTMQRGTDHTRTVGTYAATYRCAGFSFPGDRCAVSIRLPAADAEVTRALRQVLLFGPHDGLVPTAEEEVRLEEIGSELAKLAEGRAVVGAELANNPGSAHELIQALNRYEADYVRLVSERGRIFSKYTLKSLIGGSEGPVTGTDHRVNMSRVAEIAGELGDLDLSQRRELVRSLLTVEILRADQVADWPAKLTPWPPEARVIVRLRSDGRRLNPPPEAEPTPEEEAEAGERLRQQPEVLGS